MGDSSRIWLSFQGTSFVALATSTPFEVEFCGPEVCKKTRFRLKELFKRGRDQAQMVNRPGIAGGSNS